MIRLLHIYFVLILLPVVVVMAHQVITEKASGFKQWV